MPKPLTIALGSLSLYKIKSVQAAFEQLGPGINLIPCNVESGVPKQPVGALQIQQGATNRAIGALKQLDTADFGIGIEGGLLRQDSNRGYLNTAYVCIIKPNEGGWSGSWAPTVEIPWETVKLMLGEGKELGDVYGTKGVYEAITKNRVFRWEADAIAIRLAYSQRW